MRVPVISKDNTPLMPTKPSKARRLVRDGKAVAKRDKLGEFSAGVLVILKLKYPFLISIGNE